MNLAHPTQREPAFYPFLKQSHFLQRAASLPELPSPLLALSSPGFTLSLIHGLSVPSGIDNRLKIGEISLKSTDKEDQIQISIINDLSLIIDANRLIYRKFG